MPEVEAARRVAEAVAEALARSEQEGEEAMNDLLVCLGQVWGDLTPLLIKVPIHTF